MFLKDYFPLLGVLLGGAIAYWTTLKMNERAHYNNEFIKLILTKRNLLVKYTRRLGSYHAQVQGNRVVLLDIWGKGGNSQHIQSKTDYDLNIIKEEMYKARDSAAEVLTEILHITSKTTIIAAQYLLIEIECFLYSDVVMTRSRELTADSFSVLNNKIMAAIELFGKLIEIECPHDVVKHLVNNDRKGFYESLKLCERKILPNTLAFKEKHKEDFSRMEAIINLYPKI